MTPFLPVNEQLGYCFHPPLDAHAVGHPQLDVVIRPAPTGEHFDPESVACLIATGNGAAKLHITHPWEQEKSYQVCAGELLIEDLRSQQVKAFTFGGALQIDTDARRTVCRLSSPAPLLEHARQALSLEEYLIEEVYILFAERRAAQTDDVFEQHLAAADPLLLYHACLLALRAKFEHVPATDDVRRRFKQFLHTATPTSAAEFASLAELL